MEERFVCDRCLEEFDISEQYAFDEGVYSDTILENVSVFIGLHDASICSSGVRKNFVASHGKDANSACAQNVYKCLGSGTIPPHSYKSVLIDPLGSELYSPYAGITCYITVDGTYVYTDHCPIFTFQ